MSRHGVGGPAPVLTFGAGLVVPMLVVSVVVAAGSWAAPALPDAGGPWPFVGKALRVDAPRSLPFWWMVVVLVVAALSCHAQAGWRAWRGRWVPALSWWVLASGMAWLALDHALAIHSVVRRWTWDALPGPLGPHPVEGLLLLLLTPAAAVALLTATGRRQQVLLLAAAALVLAGEVAVGHRLIDLGLIEHRRALVEAALQWAGALALVAAAGTGDRRRGW